MGSRRDDELARTMTADASEPAAGPAGAIGAALGRYRLERELGAGAMGVVHLAFDPDLERRVAIKVIKSEAASAEARDRLLREARAMARLAHPNVVTVHEVGTAGGRDFVAMELIHGESLADWLRGERRAPAAILDAFIAAGRGLAAAHAAGIVHRDFKPHNVLRSRDGRIVVTDFGLARDVAVDDVPAAALDQTLPVGARSIALTMTGALLGTPAYMAPEQWRGGAVSPATDQFAYCVALWEALAGARPYPGPTLDELRTQIARGPTALDGARIPRKLRAILRRGLAIDPSARWPSMEALLAQLVRAQRRPVIAVAIGGGALVAAAVAVLAVRGGGAAIAACDPPARDIDAAWSPALRVDTQAHGSAERAAVLDAASWRWRAARATACTAPPAVRPAQLACLDGVLGRFDAVRQAFARVPAADAEEVQAALVDPKICLAPAAADVPRLTLAPTPAAIDAYALYARAQTADKPASAAVTAIADQATADPCARAAAALAFEDADPARQRAVMSRAAASADQCGDERLRADLLIRAAAQILAQLASSEQRTSAVQQAERAAKRVTQPDLAAAVAGLQFSLARWRNDLDAEARLVDDEIAGYRARGLARRELDAVLRRDDVRLSRLAAGDLDAVAADVARWRPLAAARRWTDEAWELDFKAANLRGIRGNLPEAHDELVRLWQARPASARAAGQTITGTVVDDHGRPVAGATVASSLNLLADSAGIGLPFSNDSLQIVTADANGQFVIRDAVIGSGIIAQRGDRRSLAVPIADHIHLVIEPTRTVSGKVDLGGTDPIRVRVYAVPLDATVQSLEIASVAADGTFALAGVPRGAMVLQVRIIGQDRGRDIGVTGEYRQLPASPASIGGIALALKPATRAIDIVVRSSVATTLGAAAAWVMPGRWAIKSVRDLRRTPVLSRSDIIPQPVGDVPPPALASLVRRDDLLAHVEHVPDGELTVCAASLPTQAEASADQLRAHIADLVVRCKQLGPGDARVVIDVPPQQRFD